MQRLAEIPGLGDLGAQTILAEIGLDMTRFPTAEHLVSWAKLCPRTIQSGAKNTTGKTGKGNPYLKATLGHAAATAARTDTFLAERYRRIVKRRGKLKAVVAVARYHPDHHLAPTNQPHHPLPRPRQPLLRTTHRQRTKNPQPPTATTSPRLHRHPHRRRLNTSHATPDRPPARHPHLPKHPTMAKLLFSGQS
ncbi:transposase, partial [Paractinoplanes rhizophilus]